LNPQLVIAGSGKMAVNIGLFFLQKGYPVHWFSHSGEQLQILEKKTAKTAKRLQRLFPEQSGSFQASFSNYETQIKQPQIVIESSREDLEIKKSIFKKIESTITDRTLLLSNSSSILPDRIHPRCLGSHFFYPVELTSLVELISCKGSNNQKTQQVQTFLEKNGFDLIRQNERSAFTINRLLLPLQTLCFEALREGFSPNEVEQTSKSELIGFGQLSLMDSIGLDVVRGAVDGYKDHKPAIVEPNYKLLISSLDRLLGMGKLGLKNRDGLLHGRKLPWPETNKDRKSLHQLHKRFKQLLKDSIHSALQQQAITKKELAMCMDRIFHASLIPDVLTSE